MTIIKTADEWPCAIPRFTNDAKATDPAEKFPVRMDIHSVIYRAQEAWFAAMMNSRREFIPPNVLALGPFGMQMLKKLVSEKAISEPEFRFAGMKLLQSKTVEVAIFWSPEPQ